MGLNSEAQMYQKYLEMIKLLNIYLNHFPAHERYAFCTRIRNNAQELFDNMIDAQQAFHKKTSLSYMKKYHERVRGDVMLAFDLGYLEYKDGKQSDKTPKELAAHRYLAISRLIDEFGRMIGGWTASLQAKQQEAS